MPSLLLPSLKSLKLQSQGSLVPRQVGHRDGTNYAVEIGAEQDTDCIITKWVTSWVIGEPWQGFSEEG